MNEETLDRQEAVGLRKYIHLAKRAGEAAIVGAELSPLNESIRFGAYGAALAATGGDPLIGAAVLGGTTFAVEGAGALAAADLMDSKSGGGKIIGKINERMHKFTSPSTKLSPMAEAGLAMAGGSAVVLAAKQVKDPSRTAEQNRRHGIFTAGWMSAYFAAEGALGPEVFEKILNNYNNPEKVGPALIALAGLVAVGKKTKNRLKKESQWFIPHKVREVVSGESLNSDQVETSASQYNTYRDNSDQSLKIGLYGNDTHRAISDPDSTLVKVENQDKTTKYMPLLVPVEKLEWYNLALLRAKYGGERELLYYAHPPLPKDRKSQKLVDSAIKEKLDKGAIIITDNYQDVPSQLEEVSKRLNNKEDQMYKVENLSGGEEKRNVEVYAGTVDFNGVDEAKKAPSVRDVYRRCLESGEIDESPENGTSLIETIEGADAERLWHIYENPFDELGSEHPTLAGFDKQEFMQILEDPSVTKVVNRVDGVISTLAIFVQDFDKCPWFNKEHFRENYPDHYNSGNIVIFPGIVSDENMRGHRYSQDVIDLAINLFAKRETNALVAFECTETSARYIPKIVKEAFEKNGVANVSGLDSSISTIDYSVIRKP